MDEIAGLSVQNVTANGWFPDLPNWKRLALNPIAGPGLALTTCVGLVLLGRLKSLIVTLPVTWFTRHSTRTHLRVLTGIEVDDHRSWFSGR